VRALKDRLAGGASIKCCSLMLQDQDCYVAVTSSVAERI
jgi:hypothetical protein